MRKKPANPNATLAAMPPRLRPDQVAIVLNVSRAYVVSLIREGLLPAVDIGNGGVAAYRVQKESLAAFIAKRTGGHPA